MPKFEGFFLGNSDVLAVPLTVDGVAVDDPEGLIPYQLLIDGTVARVPRWQDYTTVDSRSDRLVVTWQQNGISTVVFDERFRGPIVQLEFEIPLTPQLMSLDGVAFLDYVVFDADENRDPAERPLRLTIDHSQRPIQKLEVVSFPHATRWGYLNCATRPELKDGVTIEVPPQVHGEPGDTCKLQWQGYKNLNATIIVDEAFAVVSKVIGRDDLDYGFKVVLPFRPALPALIDNASATVTIMFFRGGRLIAQSAPEVIRIDRKIPGEVLPCYSNS
ncbi:hypothetical protein [Pseudomonas prosekii]|uniref:hypothetical protein n=1 Tax=Pseudomonas prosekii TaxID=1148509 RepID=UPI003F7566DC